MDLGIRKMDLGIFSLFLLQEKMRNWTNHQKRTFQLMSLALDLHLLWDCII